MRVETVDRDFEVAGGIRLRHVADLHLESDEVVTFRAAGTEFDVTRKDWGYYATGSLNERLPNHGLHPVIVSSGERIYLLLCEQGRENDFHAYLNETKMKVVKWL